MPWTFYDASGNQLVTPGHSKYLDSEAITAVEGEATLVLAGDVTIDGAKSLKVDVIDEKDSGAGVTVDGLLIKDGTTTALDYGLSFQAIVTTATSTTVFVASGLTGKGNDFFTDYYAYVVWDAGGAGGAPQAEIQKISDYVSSTGTFTHPAFTVQLAVTDEVLILHKSIAFAFGAPIDATPLAKGLYDILHKDGNFTFDNTTDSLEALRDFIALIPTTAMRGTNDAALASAITASGPTKAEMDTAHALLSTVSKQDVIDGIVDAILVDTGTTLDALLKQKGGRITIPSTMQETVVVNASAGNKSLPSVVVPSGTIPPNATITRVLAAISWGKKVNSDSSVNAVNVAQNIQIDITGGFSVNAITIPDNAFHTAASATEGGFFFLGIIDVKAEVADGSTSTFQWTSADVDAASLTFHDVQMWLIIEYE